MTITHKQSAQQVADTISEIRSKGKRGMKNGTIEAICKKNGQDERRVRIIAGWVDGGVRIYY